MLRAGELNRRLTLQRQDVTRGSSGGIEKRWSDIAVNIACAVRELSGNERQSSSAGGKVAVARTEFTIRWRPGVVAQMRALYGGRIYDIQHVSDFKARREFLILTCDTGLNDG